MPFNMLSESSCIRKRAPPHLAHVMAPFSWRLAPDDTARASLELVPGISAMWPATYQRSRLILISLPAPPARTPRVVFLPVRPCASKCRPAGLSHGPSPSQYTHALRPPQSAAAQCDALPAATTTAASRLRRSTTPIPIRVLPYPTPNCEVVEQRHVHPYVVPAPAPYILNWIPILVLVLLGCGILGLMYWGIGLPRGSFLPVKTFTERAVALQKTKCGKSGQLFKPAFSRPAPVHTAAPPSEAVVSRFTETTPLTQECCAGPTLPLPARALGARF
ncbi:hypothetical protein DFH09DRAFT_1330676 [Mycena vulgaris]|nr:hypothetical protein DFH09DRAFT_1330676 [Mycena vulgaris]